MTFAFRLEAANLIFAGGGVLFFAAGLAILFLARGSHRGRLIGAFAALWGLSNAVQNVVGYGETERALDLVLEVAAFIALVRLVAHVAAPLTGRSMAAFVLLIAVTGIGLASFAYGTVERLVDNRPFDQWSNFAVSALMPSTLVLLTAACVLRPETGEPETRRAGRGWLLLGLSSGIYASYFTALSAARPTSLATHGVTALNISGFILASVLCALLLVIMMRRPPDRSAARWTFATLLGAGLLACMMELFGRGGLGTFGFTRPVGVVLLAVAVVKYDLMGVPLPKLALHRSVVAGGALVTLFIVAEIAQNFLSSEYGLVMGGIIAGLVLFAANPIQRAAERLTERAAPDSKDAKDPRSSEETFRVTLRKYLADGHVTREEEGHIARLASRLGIDAERAHTLRVEAEAELGAHPLGGR